MKQTLKKMVVWLVLLSMIVTLFASCDTPDDSDHTHGTSSSTEETSSSTENTSSSTGETSSSTEESTSNTEPHRHSFGEWVVKKEATCTADGEQERSCSCGTKETKTLKAVGHVILTDSAKLPTCTEPGFTEKQRPWACPGSWYGS